MQKQPLELFYKKSCTQRFWGIPRKMPVLESFFNEVARLQDCCKSYLLHAQLRFYFSLVKTFKNFINILLTMSLKSIVYLLKTVNKCKVMFTEVYLEPSRTSMMGLFFAKIYDGTFFCKNDSCSLFL